MNDMMCRACGGSDVEEIIDLGPQPLAGGFLPPEAEAIDKEKRYPLPIGICHNCGLVQTLHVIPPDTLFRNYCFSSSTIPYLVKHFEDYAKWLRMKFSPEVVVEFGCNDGILLSPLEGLGIKAWGVDISENITEIARNKGLHVITGFFDKTAVQSILGECGKADIVTGSNSFPHNDDPGIILEAAREMLKADGHLVLEFMYAGDLLGQFQWDSMYHEHLSYFSVQTLEVLLRRYGFHVVDVERIPMHAGSLRVVAAADAGEEPKGSVRALIEYEKSVKLTDVETWRNFGDSVERKIEVVSNVLRKLSTNTRIWGYGAAGRATMWVNACKMDYLEAIVDSSPLRSGRLMPGTHTPIVFPESLKLDPPDCIFVTAWNYVDIIKAKESWYKGIWAVPVPELAFF